MAKKQEQPKPVGSTTSLGKRRSLGKNKSGRAKQRAAHDQEQQQQQQQPAQPQQQPQQSQQQQQQQHQQLRTDSASPRSSEYGSQASPVRVPLTPKELTKVTIVGAAGGIGQPLALLLMLHSEYIQHIALYDLMDSIRGIGTDLSHLDRQCKLTTHLGEAELAEAVRGAKVILVPAGLAQKPGMSRDDLFGSNAKIMYNIAKVCAQVAPEAMLAIITNPVNSLVPLACEIYQRFGPNGPAAPKSGAGPGQASARVSESAGGQADQQQQQQLEAAKTGEPAPRQQHQHQPLVNDCHRRIFGVTTLDVVRASSLLARSSLFKSEPNGLFKDPSKFQVPVVGGHAGKTIMPLLSQAAPKLDRKRLADDRTSTLHLIESIQQAGIEVLNDKKGKGSATLAMAYAACRFTISLLRAQLGESNIVECAYVRHSVPVYADLEYFATPLLLGRDGYTKSLGLGKQLLSFEEQMLEEGARELRLSIVKGEDFAKEHLSAER